MEERVEGVRNRISSACARSGRDEQDVVLVAVAKKHGPEEVARVFECGVDVVGENRVQEAVQKIPLAPGGIEWHMVGHLQTNKARAAVAFFEMIHSVDSLRLLKVIDQECASAGRVMQVCLEVNVSGEGSKFGFDPDDVPGALGEAQSMMNVDVAGLMTMPPLTEAPEGARPHFARLRELRDKWSVETGFGLNGLSMGMSDDFEVAIEEGATWVRIGTLIFGERK